MSARQTYLVHAIAGPTLQGEGMHAGAPCLILRLAGCNAWDGRASTKATSACPSCDTMFRQGTALGLATIRRRLASLRKGTSGLGLILTGGEPLLQTDAAMLSALGHDFPWVDVETNGTRPCPKCPKNVRISCSPKEIPGQPLIILRPDWWKILVPDQLIFLETALASGRPVFVQPVCPADGLDSVVYRQNLDACLALCRLRGVRLGLQWHRYLGLP